MSLSHYRDSMLKRLQTMTDTAANKAINMRIHPQLTADTYALVQADTLSEARAYAEAAKIVIDEYRKLTEATKDGEPEGDEPKQEKREKIYG